MDDSAPILYFDKKYRFLSNFGEGSVTYAGVTYVTNENFYQAMKTRDENLRREIASMSPGESKKAGRKLKIRDDWEWIKDAVMMFGLRVKFRNCELMDKLTATGNRLLVEGNSWHDTYWGVCDGKCKTPHAPIGQNTLGRMLMSVRSSGKIIYTSLTEGDWPTMFSNVLTQQQKELF